MQATVLTFDPAIEAGSVLLDSGEAVPFSADVFRASHLRLLRAGQRLRIKRDENGVIVSLTIATLADPS